MAKKSESKVSLEEIADTPSTIVEVAPEEVAVQSSNLNIVSGNTSQDALEERRRKKLEACAAEEKLPPVNIIYVPGPGTPGHSPAFFGKPYDVWLTPGEPTKVPGTVAKLMACNFPRKIFMDDGNGNPVPFPSSQLKKNPLAEGAPKR